MPYILLTREPLEELAISDKIGDQSQGAHVTFLGTVRNNSRGQHVSYLEYEAYEPMAHKQLAALATQAEQRWSVNCAMGHRLGRVMAGECSVVIAVASEHRDAAFEACRWLLESLKETAPIWKKEFYEGGARWIEGSDAVASKTD